MYSSHRDEWLLAPRKNLQNEIKNKFKADDEAVADVVDDAQTANEAATAESEEDDEEEDILDPTSIV